MQLTARRLSMEPCLDLELRLVHSFHHIIRPISDLTAEAAYDPELAKKLLAEAGYADGFKTTLKLPPPTYARRGGEIIAAQRREIGIEAEIIPVEWAQWLDQVFKDQKL